jgi:hypothetical protein
VTTRAKVNPNASNMDFFDSLPINRVSCIYYPMI